jgi:hypothetical protein
MADKAQQTPIESLPADIQNLIRRLRRERERYRLEAKQWRAKCEGNKPAPK